MSVQEGEKSEVGLKRNLSYWKDAAKGALRRLGLSERGYGRKLLGRTTSSRTSLSQATVLDVGFGPKVKILHNRNLSDREENQLKSGMKEARLEALTGAAGLSSRKDHAVHQLNDEFENCFQFQPAERPDLAQRVAHTAQLVANGVMSENLSVKFYRKGEKREMDIHEAQGMAEMSFADDKNSKVVISLHESALQENCSQLLNHEVSHNVAALTDYGDRGYSTPDFTEISGKMVPTQVFTPDQSGRMLKPKEAVLNADSIAAYLHNRTQVVKVLEADLKIVETNAKTMTSTATNVHHRSAGSLERDALLNRPPRDVSSLSL